MQTIQLFGAADDSIVDGPGIRFAIFVQGCAHNCEGCHNPGALPFKGGGAVTVDDLWRRIKGNPLISGITLSGGEPFEQPEPLLELARRARAQGLNVWVYSGYRYEELLAGTPSDSARELLAACDVLVDGRYIAAQASYALKWRGSANQRIIDVAASLAAGEVIEMDKE
jgi:anaerobic ribonucleoside-triphosphate reductase activating protein